MRALKKAHTGIFKIRMGRLMEGAGERPHLPLGRGGRTPKPASKPPHKDLSSWRRLWLWLRFFRVFEEGSMLLVKELLSFLRSSYDTPTPHWQFNASMSPNKALKGYEKADNNLP